MRKCIKPQNSGRIVEIKSPIQLKLKIFSITVYVFVKARTQTKLCNTTNSKHKSKFRTYETNDEKSELDEVTFSTSSNMFFAMCAHKKWWIHVFSSEIKFVRKKSWAFVNQNQKSELRQKEKVMNLYANNFGIRYCILNQSNPIPKIASINRIKYYSMVNM